MTTDLATRPPELTRYDVVMTRLYDAPRDDVFDAWSSEERLLRWFGPHLFPAVSFDVDFRAAAHSSCACSARTARRRARGANMWRSRRRSGS